MALGCGDAVVMSEANANVSVRFILLLLLLHLSFKNEANHSYGTQFDCCFTGGYEKNVLNYF